MITQTPHKHSPCTKQTPFLSFWEFFFFSSKLFDLETGLGRCAICGITIQLPTQKIRKWVVNIISVVSLLLGVFVKMSTEAFIMSKTSLPLQHLLSLLATVLLFFLMKRIYLSIVLSREEWGQYNTPKQEEWEYLAGAKKQMQQMKQTVSFPIFQAWIYLSLLITLI